MSNINQHKAKFLKGLRAEARKKRVKEGVKEDVYHHAVQGAHKLSRNAIPGNLGHGIATAVGTVGGALHGMVKSLGPKVKRLGKK